jgi:hypothetical protein
MRPIPYRSRSPCRLVTDWTYPLLLITIHAEEGGGGRNMKPETEHQGAETRQKGGARHRFETIL